MNDEKEQLIDRIIDGIQDASPETMQSATSKWMKMGGKWEMLARFLMGEEGAEERYLHGDFGEDSR